MSTEPTQTKDKPGWAAPIESRRERADYYFQTVLENQRDWYSEKAGTQKRRHLFFAISVIVLGTLISCLQVIEAAAWIRYLTAGLGAFVSVLRAVDTLLHPGETWQGYRKASENMKREYRLYINNADVYADASDEDAAYRLLVERVETILAEEQQLFWQFHAKNPVPQSTMHESEPD
ncbi:MAG: DUF4231 domain-containing protein [Methylobacter sp.]|nr:DUF4231 domain-containing protein [Methylobacter sp.]